MTDPGFADRTYLEPLDLEGVTDVLQRERPDALLPTLGGQTALNLSMQLAEAGVLDQLGVELIGAGIDAIKRAEDRELFREAVRSVGLRVPTSRASSPRSMISRHHAAAVIRPASRSAVMARASSPHGRRHPVRRPDPAEARPRDRGRRASRYSRHAVRRGRPRRGPRALRRGCSTSLGDPLSRVGDRRRTRREAAEICRAASATRCSSGPRTCSAGSAMRVCYRRRRRSRTAMPQRPHAARCSSTASSRGALEIDVDALCDGVAEPTSPPSCSTSRRPAIHSGDSAVRPARARRSTATPAREVEPGGAAPRARAREPSACSTSSSPSPATTL